ncbi:MAG: putative capsular polysaccharide synthesis family protein [Caulobacter sp.]
MTNDIVLSFSRTGSQALVSAFSAVSPHPVTHLHFLGMASLEQRRAAFEARGEPLPPMLRAAFATRALMTDPAQRFRIVSCIRDPIARQVSHLFKFPEIAMADGVDVLSEPDRAADWMVENFFRRSPLTWFDDHICDPFGIDLFATPFDRTRRDLRFEREGLKLVVVRMEDPADLRERALGWLTDRPRVEIVHVDPSVGADYAWAFKAFRDSFVAPPSLIDRIYGSRMMRHFYDDEERRAMAARWSP